MRIGNHVVDLSSEPEAQKVIFDTGTSVSVIADPAYTIMITLLVNQGCIWSELDDTTICSCTEDDIKFYPTLTIYMRGLESNLPPESYLIPDADDPVKKTL